MALPWSDINSARVNHIEKNIKRLKPEITRELFVKIVLQIHYVNIKVNSNVKEKKYNIQ